MDCADAELTPEECWELLAMATVGRVALSVRALPTILPVRYTMDGKAVSIALGRNGPPTASVHDAIVAFAVDDIDERAGSGWIVQVQGRARLASPAAAPIGGGPDDVGQIVEVVPGTVSGHRFTLRAVPPRP